MAYSSGNLILDDHYNSFASDTNDVWGTGSGDYGYGQANTVSSVSAGSTITATQWATLLSRIASAASHQGSSITTISGPSAGNTISAYTALSGNITAIRSNRQNYAANGTDITSGGSKSYTSSWIGSVTATYTITFGSADQIRLFDNCGGTIRVDFARSGGTTTNKNSEWTDTCNKAGPVSINPYGLSGSYAQKSKTYADSSPYTANYIKTSAYKSGSIVYIKVEYVDAAPDARGSFGEDAWMDIVNGTLTTTAVVRPPSSTYITSTWGSQSIVGSVTGTNAY
jgi:hypothetical protein